MGRKIPGKKHKGVKDPEKQREVRSKKLQNKINAPPTNPDEQQIPKRLSHLMEIKNKLKSGEISLKRKRRQKNSGPIKIRPQGIEFNFNSTKKQVADDYKPTPVFFKHKNESDWQFMNKVSKICSSALKENEYENKFGINIKRNPQTGMVEKVEKRPKNEMDEYFKKAKKLSKKKGGLKNINIEIKPKLSKSQKRAKKLAEKKKLIKNGPEVKDFSNYVDKVKFGEVAHEPPSLTLPKKVERSIKPGSKDLLLKSIMSIKSTSETSEKHKTLNKVIDKKGKRKHLPVALRRQLDKQQKEIVDAYRTVKKKNWKSVI